MKSRNQLWLAGGALLIVAMPFFASAHRSGCHRWHSCPSDTGSYVCGDLGYISGCPKTINPSTTQTNPKIQPSSPIVDNFVGKPKTRTDLYNCTVVGNYNSMIYHTKGSSFIRKMVVSNKYCFGKESDAVSAGFRKSKVR